VTVNLYEPSRPPRIWIVWLGTFGASAGLASRLWRALLETRRAGELGVITRAGRRRDRRSVAAMLAVCTPERMLALTCALAPEGVPREQEIVELERNVLAKAQSPTAWR
jgi:hypothetical protein